MARLKKKERTLLDRVLDREEIDFTQFTMQEIKQVISDLVDMQHNRIRKVEILKLQDIVIKASEKIKDILETEK